MSENIQLPNNGVNKTGTVSEGLAPGRCPMAQQRGPGRQPVTAARRTGKVKWTKEFNKQAIECYLRSQPNVRGYRKRMLTIWKTIGLFEVTEAQLTSQVRCIRDRGWLSEVEMEEIERKINKVDTEIQEEGTSDNKRTTTPNNDQGDVRKETQEVHDWETHQTEKLNHEQRSIVEMLKTKLGKKEQLEQVNLRSVDRRKVREKTKLVNEVINKIQTKDISETNSLILAGANVVAELVGMKKRKIKAKQPWWKKRILMQISTLRKDLSRIEEWKKDKLYKENVKTDLEKRYYVRNKGISTVAEELKQRIKAKTAKINKYEERNKQFLQNRLFQTNQKRLFEIIEGIERNSDITPDAEESKTFWGDIWDNEVKHNEQAKWIQEVEDYVQTTQKPEMFIITLDRFKKQLKKTPKWKASGPDNVSGYWLKSFSSLHGNIVDQMNELLNTGEVPQWMTKGKTCLILKDKTKGNLVSNFRPITCLPVMWKLFTGMLAEEIYEHLDLENLLPDEQKGCRRNSRGTKDQLIIDKMVQKNCKRRLTNLCMAWIDYKKAYDMVPHSWISKCLDMFKVADNVKEIINRSMNEWSVQLTSAGKNLGEVNIRRGIFQGDSLSPILFVMSLIPLSIILNKMTTGYALGKGRAKINHLLFMDDLKLYSKTMDELDSLVQTVRIFSNDIAMEFGISKCAMVEVKRGKMVKREGIDLPDGSTIQSLEVGAGYKYLGVLQSDRILSKEMKVILKKEYFRRLRKILNSKLNAGNTIHAINSRAVSIIRYGAGIIDWTKLELDEMDRKTRKMLTIYRAMHPRSDVDRLYWKRSEGGRGLQSIRDTVKVEKASLGFYLEGTDETLLKEVLNENLYETVTDPKIVKEKIIKTRKDSYEGKNLHSALFKKSQECRDNKDSWLWLKKGYLKKETEGTILAAQDQAIRTRWVQRHIDKKDIPSDCRMCGEKEETVAHITSECRQLAQNEYKKCRHDKVAACLHWNMCKKYGFTCPDKSYEHFIGKESKVLENDEVKLLWDFPIQTESKIDHNRPDIVLIHKKEKLCFLIDVACPFDTRIDKKEKEKLDAYSDLKYEILKCWKKDINTVVIIPVVVGALGMVTNKLKRYLEKIKFNPGIEPLQKACLLGTARILRKVLDCQ